MELIKFFFSRQFLWELIRISVVGLATILFYFDAIPVLVLVAFMAFGIYRLARTAFEAIIRMHKVGTEFFITVAITISIIGHEYLAGAIVLMILLIAEYISAASGEKARASIKELIGSVPKTAIVRKDNDEMILPIADLQIGDIVLIKTGDKIPVDGIVIKGSGAVNQATITGESVPQEKSKGDEVFAGTIVDAGALYVRMTKTVKNTVFSRIIALVEDVESKKAHIEKLTDKVAAWLIPIVFIFVALVFIITKDVKLVIALLIFTSPAELGLATPLVNISSIARAAREGILIKGGLYLEELAKVTSVVFDKTGTLTVGHPEVVKIEAIDKNTDEKEILGYAAIADYSSGHPLASTILEYAKRKNVKYYEPDDFEIIKGCGVKAIYKKQTILLGNAQLMNDNGVCVVDDCDISNTVVYLAKDGLLLGSIHLTDAIRSGTREMLAGLKRSGVKKIIMLTGDNEKIAEQVAKATGISDFHANLLPEDKIIVIKELQNNGEKVAMVGDGINDAPALMQANVGIAMGAIGTEAAMEAADIVLVEDKLDKIARARAISRIGFKTIKQNIIYGVGVVHITGIILVLSGVLGPIAAAIIHLVPDTLVFLNSMKILKIKIRD